MSTYVYLSPDFFTFVSDIKDEWIAGESQRGSSLLGNLDRFGHLTKYLSLSPLFQNLPEGNAAPLQEISSCCNLYFCDKCHDQNQLSGGRIYFISQVTVHY